MEGWEWVGWGFGGGGGVSTYETGTTTISN